MIKARFAADVAPRLQQTGSKRLRSPLSRCLAWVWSSCRQETTSSFGRALDVAICIHSMAASVHAPGTCMLVIELCKISIELYKISIEL